MPEHDSAEVPFAEIISMAGVATLVIDANAVSGQRGAHLPARIRAPFECDLVSREPAANDQALPEEDYV